MNIVCAPASARRADQSFEVVERKGQGHPDTLADALAEHLSRVYARYTLDAFGAVLHHQFDKVGILGGRVRVDFGSGELLSPVRVLLNGRASASYAGTAIPVRDLLTDACRSFFADRFAMLDLDRDLRLIYEVSTGDSPGGIGAKDTASNRRSRWFNPAGIDDLPELRRLACNDTSSGAAYGPFTPTERFVLDVEKVLAGAARPPWLGSDVKVMACRTGRRVEVTACVPQLARHVPDLDAYRANLDWARDRLAEHAARLLPDHETLIHLNMRDDYDRPELYLTLTGSSIETGDEGLVGRGNRYGGLISAGRPFTMEGISGKNPVYHTGKVYCIGADLVVQAVAESYGLGAEVVIIGQTGQLITDPHAVLVTVEPGRGAIPDADELRSLITDRLKMIPDTLDGLLSGAFALH
ncbi:methionine adenosyltransferase [Actinomadura atramentaria]|uniref:methionine adenosyltransferase n=1 Tax=Actinomadura atramentaria TaxID=1990 RepID=UPI00036D788F|nr:methionine adenosyltransferase [Actinomadura atramentaria]